MKSLRSQPQTTFPGTKEEVRLFNRACAEVGLSETQRQHLLTRVFFDPSAVAYFVAMHRDNTAKAEQWLVRMSPPRGPEDAPQPNARLSEWRALLARVARAAGLLS